MYGLRTRFDIVTASAGLILLALLFGSCGSSQADASPKHVPDIGTPGIASAAGDPVLASASAAQTSALEDGVVTLDEKNTAFRNMKECLAGHNISVVLNPDDSFVTAAPKEMSAAEARVLSNDCAFAHYIAVNKQWQFQHRPSEEKVAEARSALRACLVENGVAMPESPTTLDFLDVQSRGNPEAFARCSTQVSTAFGLSGFAG